MTTLTLPTCRLTGGPDGWTLTRLTASGHPGRRTYHPDLATALRRVLDEEVAGADAEDARTLLGAIERAELTVTRAALASRHLNGG